MKRSTWIKSSFFLLFAATLYVGCGKKGTGQIPYQFVNNLPFQVKASDPDYLATGVSLTTTDVQVFLTEPVDINTVATNYKLTETVGASTKTIKDCNPGTTTPPAGETVCLAGVVPFQGGTSLLFKLGGVLTYNAGYSLTLYPGIVSSLGNYLSYLTHVSFSTGPTDSFGFGEIIKAGPPDVIGGDAGIVRDIYCGCLTVYARFTESLARAPIFRYEIDNFFGLFGGAFSNGGSGQLSAYPVFTNDTTTWGIFMGCSAQNQAWDRKLNIWVVGSSVFDLTGEQMGQDRHGYFSNSLGYTCP